MPGIKVRIEPMHIMRKGFKTRLNQDMVIVTDNSGQERQWGYLSHATNTFCPLVGFPNEHLDEVCRLLSELQNTAVKGYQVAERQPDADFVGNDTEDNYQDEDE